MAWSKKINSKKYFLGTLINMLFAVVFGYPSPNSIFWLSFVVIATVVNHYATIMVFGGLFEAQITHHPVNKLRLLFHLLIKGVSLLAPFILLVKYSRDVVLQGLAMYIFQLIILCLSIKNIGQFIKKGTHQ